MSDPIPVKPQPPVADTIQSRWDPRLPPGQIRTDKWPVLHCGLPKVELATWDFRVHGLVERPARWT
jgi:DMSO/TMAO reductase YedYZ molybdopterin-dependent catalytic subunit